MRNSFLKIPRRALGDFHTTMFIASSFLPSPTGAAAGDQQRGHQKHQHPRGKNGRDQNTASHGDGKHADDAVPPSPKHQLRLLPYAPVYGRPPVPGSGYGQKKDGTRCVPSSVSKKTFLPAHKFSELKILKTLNLNGAGNPSWVSRAHPSLPLRKFIALSTISFYFYFFCHSRRGFSSS